MPAVKEISLSAMIMYFLSGFCRLGILPAFLYGALTNPFGTG
jgi:hypothetical protein